MHSEGALLPFEARLVGSQQSETKLSSEYASPTTRARHVHKTPANIGTFVNNAETNMLASNASAQTHSKQAQGEFRMIQHLSFPGLLWIAINKLGASAVVHYLNDFLFLANTFEKCKNDLQAFIKCCAEIGVPLAPNKTPYYHL